MLRTLAPKDRSGGQARRLVRGNRFLALAAMALFAGAFVPVASVEAQAGPAFGSDDFNRAALGSPWSVVDGVGDGNVAMVGAGTGDARLELTVPGGANHEPWNANRALRAMRPAANTDFTAVAKFQSVPALRYQMQGILVQQDEDDWLRFEVHHNGTALRAFAGSTVAGASTKRLDKSAVTGTASYLRVSRQGSTWTMATSADGSAWSTAGSFTLETTVTSVGVFAGNSGTTPPAYTAVVDYLFEASAPVEPEDGAPPAQSHTLTTNTSGPGSITRSPDKPTYSQGEAVTLTAVPAAGAVFSGWSGGATGGNNPVVVTMNADTTVTATFAASGTPPTISSVAVQPGVTSAVVTWTTNQPASSSVSAGPTTAYELGSFGAAALVTSHSVTVTGLAAGTTYHYRVSSTNGGGLTATGGDATFTTGAAPAAGFTSDDFNRNALAPVPWTVVDPVGNGSVTLTGAGTQDARVRLGVPAGTNHDAWHNNRSLRLAQPTGDGNFTAELKFDSVPTQQYQMQGLLVEQDQDDWLRFDVFFNGSSLRAYAASTTAGTTTKRLEKGVSATGSIWLRVGRTGNTWAMSTSTDGASWTSIGSFSHAIDVNTSGPFTGNSGPSPAYTALVDYVFDAAAPIVPEDTPGPVVTRALTTSTVGSGSITRSPDQPTYSNGEQVTLTAVPAAGSTFAGWSGALSGGDNPAVVTMDADKAVTATFVADTTPPVISGVGVAPGSTSAVVSWTTDEPASSSVSVGTSTAYGLGTFGSATPTRNHAVTVTGLAPGTTYHYRVSSTNGAGLTANRPDATFVTAAASGPVVDVWGGANQVFGANGRPQTWANVNGNVSDPDGVASLVYSLNGGANRALSLGPDNRRLQQPGDFNAEVPYSELQPGANTVRLTARDPQGNLTTVDVQVQRQSGAASLPYTTDWGGASRISDEGQVVDGQWGLQGDTVRIQQMGYDRIVAVGDVSWHDYEMTVPVTVHGLGPGNGSYLSGASLVGFGLNWQGHTRVNNEQPGYFWYPTGALGWYRWFSPTPKFELRGNGDSPVVRHQRFTMNFGQTYMFKARSDTVSGGVQYSWKVWPQGSAEPAAWDLTLLEPDGPATGSIILIAHHADVQFGNVAVTPLPS